MKANKKHLLEKLGYFQGRDLQWHLKLLRLTLKLRYLGCRVGYLRFQDRYRGSILGFHEMSFKDGCRPGLKGLLAVQSSFLHFVVKLLRYTYIELCHAKPIKWLNYKFVNGKFVKQPDKHV